MADIIDITDKLDSKQSAIEASQKANITFRLAFALCLLFCAITTIIFCWQRVQSINLSATIEHELFGTYGDFIGGILGTFVALYSVYMLVRTFQNQILTNENVVSTNKSVVKANESSIETNSKLVIQTSLQIFDSRYFALFQLYKDAVSAYDCGDIKGRSAFEEIVRQFKIKGLDNKTEYKRRSISAVTEYLNLYVSNRRNMSVHFRVLYLLTKLTAEEKIYDSYRASYAKSIRGQLSDEELLILRYNCLSPYGEKMRIYVNKFNLLKHMPIMDLLEFTRWRNVIDSEHYCSAIDQLVIRVKKLLIGFLDSVDCVHYEYKVSTRLSFDFNLNSTHDACEIIYTILHSRQLPNELNINC